MQDTSNNNALKYNILTGTITPALLIITGAFVIVIYGLLFVLTLQLNYSHRQIASERALNIAEVGVNYYAWHLSHDPYDYKDGGEDEGPYVHRYSDPEGGEIGSYSLEITPPEEGSSIVTIRSTGWVDEYPGVTRTIVAKYGTVSLSEFSFLSNASAWYGEGSVVTGRIHSNNGIRMDGTNTAVVSSAKETYKCGQETGCHPPVWKPGVWGSGGDQGLWRFPVPQIDFDSFSFDFAGMRDGAQTDGLYLEPSGKRGYHIEFVSDGTVKVSEIKRVSFVEGYSVPGQGLGKAGVGGCEKLHQIIENETLIGTYNVTDVPVIFVEDDIWVEGDVRGRVTVAAVHFPVRSSQVNIWIPDNITYTSYDGSDSLGLIAQNDIYFGRDVPDDFKIDAVLMSQLGKIIRHGYFDWCGGAEEAVKDKLTIIGSVVSYFNSYWNFGTGPESGFTEVELYYDPNVSTSPPPYYPSSGAYQFISWEEE